jgi:hypothetical protein
MKNTTPFTVWLIEDNEAYRTAALRIVTRMSEVRDTRGFKSCEASSNKQWMENGRLRLSKLAANLIHKPDAPLSATRAEPRDWMRDGHPMRRG